MHPSLMPPESLEGHDPREVEEWRTEFDDPHLARRRHEVRSGVDSLSSCAVPSRTEADIIFNLGEFDGVVGDQHHRVPGNAGQPRIRAAIRAAAVSRDKALCKQVFAFTASDPQFAGVPPWPAAAVPRAALPLFVKPPRTTRRWASRGLGRRDGPPARAIEFVGSTTDVLVEEFVRAQLRVGMS
jgi:hypothetical protein